MPENICIHNGRIWTDGKMTENSGIVISDGDIRMVSNDANVLRYIGGHIQDYQVIDAGKRVIFPGFTDSHLHLSEWARRFDHMDLEPFASLEETLEFIRVSSKGREWLIGGGWNQNNWPERRWPHRSDLDFLPPGVKAILYSKDFHSAWVNDEVIDLFNMKSVMEMIQKGYVERDSNGRLSGLLREDALSVLLDPIMEQQIIGIYDSPAVYFKQFHSYGICSVHSMESFAAYYKFLQMYQYPHNRGLRLGIFLYEKDREMAFEYGLTMSKGGLWFKFLGLKGFLDGALGSQTAWLKEPYENDMDTGKQIWRSEDLYRFIGLAEGRNCPISLHAIGDAAVEQLLDVVESFGRPLKIPIRIEHAQLTGPESIKRMKALGMSVSANPSHIFGDRKLAEFYWGERSRHAFPLKSFTEAEINMAFSSDAPVEDINPWKGIAAAVYRDGGDKEETWYPDECISLDQALLNYTFNPARLSGEENRKGRLAKSYVGDLFIASQDPFSCDAESIIKTRSLMTVIDGRIVYDRLNQE